MSSRYGAFPAPPTTRSGGTCETCHKGASCAESLPEDLQALAVSVRETAKARGSWAETDYASSPLLGGRAGRGRDSAPGALSATLVPVVGPPGLAGRRP